MSIYVFLIVNKTKAVATAVGFFVNVTHMGVDSLSCGLFSYRDNYTISVIAFIILVEYNWLSQTKVAMLALVKRTCEPVAHLCVLVGFRHCTNVHGYF